VSLLVEKDEAADEVNVGFFSAPAEVSEAGDVADFV
jgi:hypothetical protein